ncbi:MAG: hypothetical protein KJO69_04320 [Gammaproteobacteria bacterium]|nr:hypothetical protein [Gammaproteobacteria bacterium]NNJ71632.1 hypothetical protein [Enterobacterales bacterium]
MAESLISELKRRNVFKVAAAYVVLAWVVVQVTDQAVAAFAMPDWVNTVVFFFGLIGFPFVMLFAWAFELTPEGIRREVEVNPDQSITDKTGKKLNAVTMSLLVIALAYFVYESRFQERATDDTVVEQDNIETISGNSEIAEEKAVSEERLSELPGSSIAVLPFVNMSSDPEQEFFSDGISEEILNVLAQIPNLHVTSRSSAFSFKGKEIILSEVASKLGVANILEGSVRKAGNQVRVTAQLIEAETDKHLWSETYDRELNDIFAIQDEISQAIVVALKEHLNLEKDIQVVAATEVDLNALQAFLKGRSLLERRNLDDLRVALNEFEKAIEIEPTYAKAWMGKAWALVYLAENNYGDIPREIANERAKAANDQALQLDPKLPESYALQGSIFGQDQDFEKAAESYEKAIALNPNFANSYVWYSGDLDFEKPDSVYKQLELREKAYRLDPMSVLTLVNYGYALIPYAKFDQTLAIAEQIKLINPNSHFAYNLENEVYTETYEYGKAAYASKKAYELSPNIGGLFNVAFDLTRIGLVDEAVALVEGTEIDILKYSLQGNQEAFISQARLTLPRSENDSFGNFRRGVAETFAGNCKEAVKFFGKTNCSRCNFIMYCYKQLDAVDEFATQMQKREEQIVMMKEAGYAEHQYDGFEQYQYFLRDDLDKYMDLMKDRLSKGFILGGQIKNSPMMAPVREHEYYPKALAHSEQNRLKQLAIYQELVGSTPAAKAPF